MSTLLFAPAFTFLLQLEGRAGSSAQTAQFPSLIVAVLAAIALSELFVKAGQPGWAALVPIYDLVVLLRVVGRPWWWLFLLLVPLANVVVFLFICFDLARAFGKGRLFGLGLLALAPICQLILAFGDARYVGTAGAPSPVTEEQLTPLASARL